MEHKKQSKIKTKNMLKKHKAFTLVELIIVITILAILATIAVISFQNYTKDSRDANRVTTISNIKKWLELYSMKAWKYPSPEIRSWDSELLTWSINDNILSYLWVIWDSVSSALKINKTSKTLSIAFSIIYKEKNLILHVFNFI